VLIREISGRNARVMYFLGIETSCDETAAAVLREDGTILSSIVLSQDEIHAAFGGVVPELASRQHLKSIDFIVAEALRAAAIRLDKIDVFAVTQGPGLIGSLLVGLSFAKGLAYYFGKPLIGIDHVEAHIEAAFLECDEIELPALALVVSGGHTSLFLLRAELKYRLLGRTRDDAAGEALDKIAKFLDLGYPGGPVIEKIAESGNSQGFAFGIPRMTDRSLDYSFSGLKTAALRIIKEARLRKDSPRLPDFLASFEEAVTRALLENLARAVSLFKPRSLLLCGGVARNRRLRLRFQEFAAVSRIAAFIPSLRLCSDNAAMVAALALKKWRKKKPRVPVLDLDAYPRIASDRFLI
jgi:N6-L-threonylcarbamoyladenine synthase